MLFNVSNYSETIIGDLKKFAEEVFEASLDQFGLLESYQKDDPKQGTKEDDNYFFRI
jgi:hypothetical protein